MNPEPTDNPAPTGPVHKRPWRTLVAVVGWLVLIGLIVTLVVWPWRHEQSVAATPGTPGACARPANAIPAPAVKPGTAPAHLQLRSDQTTTLALHRTLGEQDLQVTYDISAGLPAAWNRPEPLLLRAELSPLTRDDGAVLRPTFGVAGSAVVLATTRAAVVNGRLVVYLCVDRPGTPYVTDPGTYTGIVTVSGPALTTTDLPVTVTMSYPFWSLVLGLLVLASVAGSLYAWLLYATRTGQNADPKPADDLSTVSLWVGLRRFHSWILTLGGLVPSIAGVSAAVSVYIAFYLSDDTWGNNVIQALTLFGAMFAAFVTAATTFHLGAAVAGK